MVAPGIAVVPPSVLVTVRSGAAVTGVVSEPVLSAGVGSGPLVPSSATVTVFEIPVVPAGSGVATVTAKTTDPEPPAATVPSGRVQVPAAHDHLLSDAPTSKVVLTGTVSVSTTPVAAWSPPLA